MVLRFFVVFGKMLTLQKDMEKNYDIIVERLLEGHYWVIDMLPMQVPQDSAGQFFAVEKYYREGPRYERLCAQFADVLLKLNCYYDLLVNRDSSDEWVKNPEPATLVMWLTECMDHGHLCVLIDSEDALITASSGDINMTLYNPSPDLLQLVQQLASAEGLFLWQPQDNQ